MFDVKVTFKGADKILVDKGLDEGGKVQSFFTLEVMRVSNPYVPFRAGTLQSSARITDDNAGIVYSTPYARYHWYGKLMVDPITKKGAFFNPKTGRYWSRPNTQKELTEKDLKYSGSPLHGPRWVERAWIDHGAKVIEATEKYANGGARR